MLRRMFLASAAGVTCLPAASKDATLNGRWDLVVPEDARKRVWWVEIKGAETGHASGSFIGAPGGGLDQITDMKVHHGEATWTFSRPARENTKAWKGVYKARVVGDNIEGTLQVEGDPGPVKFHGVRAPKFAPVDRSRLKEARRSSYSMAATSPAGVPSGPMCR